jgi:hypothetical protein
MGTIFFLRKLFPSSTTNPEVEKELNTSPVLGKIQEYRRIWIQHANIMPCKRLSRIIIKSTDQKADGSRGDR